MGFNSGFKGLNGKYVGSGQLTLASVGSGQLTLASLEEVSRLRERCERGSASNGDKLRKYDLACLT